MFGFLKGKNKGRNNSNQEANGKQQSKSQNKKQNKERKDRHKGRPNDACDDSQPSNLFFKKSRTLPPQNSKQEVEPNSSRASAGKFSNGVSHYNSLDQISSSDITNSTSEVSEINSKSSSCRNSYAISNSSSRASIPSITTEFIDDSTPSPNQEVSISVSSKLSETSPRPCVILNERQVSSPQHSRPNPHIPLNCEGSAPDAPDQGVNKSSSVKKTFLSAGLAMKPPLNPRLAASKGDRTPPIARAVSNEDEDTSVSSSVYSAPPSPRPTSANSSVAPNSSRPTSPDGRSSMLSTPSSSNSSLSSLSIRPTSPSGRKTPPGPRMGTNAKMGTSPTPTRKATRTNIKTNPKVTTQQRPKSPNVYDSKMNVSPKMKDENSVFIYPNSDKSLKEVPQFPESTLAASISSIENPELNEKTSCSVQNGQGVENTTSTVSNSKSVTPSPGKIRHSLASLHSLESIPEIESDNPGIHSASKTENVEMNTSSGIQNTASKVPASALPLVFEENIPDSLSRTSSNNTENTITTMKRNDSALEDHISSDTSLSTQEISTKEALCLLKATIEKEKEFTNSIMREYMETRNDDDSSESLREPEVKEHRLELIPNSIDMKNNITFITDKYPLNGMATRKTSETDLSSESQAEGNKSSCDPVNVSDPDSSSSISPHSAEATHAVFQIPLKSKSCSRERTLSPQRSNDLNEIEDQRELEHTTELPPGKLGSSNDCPPDDTDTVHCVEGHVELNFERGRSDQRTPNSPRRRSSSSARRQKLYEDIKKYTAQTKGMQIKDHRSDSSTRCKQNVSRSNSREESDQAVSLTVKGNNFAEVSKRLWGTQHQRSVSLTDSIIVKPRSHSGQRKSSNTLPRTNPRKLERSITVAEIKININNNQSSTSLPSSLEVADEVDENKKNELVEAKYEEMGVSTKQGSDPSPARPKRGKSETQTEKPKIGLENQISEKVSCSGEFETASSSLETRLPSEKKNESVSIFSQTTSDQSNELELLSTNGRAEEPQAAEKLPDQTIVPSAEERQDETGMSNSERLQTDNRNHEEGFWVERLEEGVGHGNVVPPQQQDEHNTDERGTKSCDELQKELSSLEAKFEEQVQQLKLALNQKQEELAKAKAEAEKILKQSEERSKREQQELKERSTKEQHDLKERLEREKQELEEKLRLEREERDKKELEERQKREEQRESEKKAAETASNENTSEDLNKDEGKEGDEEEEESEAESNKRKWDTLQMEILSLKQQNEEFEEMVREKHRRQIELELQIGEIGKEVTAKEAMVDSVKVELCYAKNETELTKARVKRMEEELAQYKEKVESLEQELDTSERELKRMEILQEKLQVTETKRNELQAQLDEVELERDEEIKIIQDALDEAAQEREELLVTFEKEIEKLNSVNAAREAQMLEDFETKLCELEQQHKAKLEEKERQSETTLTRGKRQPDQEEIRQRIEKMKSELNSEWEDKLRNECSRLKGELDTLHVEEKHLAVESIKVQKEQELQNLKKTFESKSEEMNKEIATLKESLSTKDAFYHKELDEIRTRADRDLWEMRRKLQKLDESSYDRQQYLEDKHREDIERLREEYSDKMAGMESQLSSVDIRGIADVRAKLEKMHKEQMEHLEQQHRLSMERLRDELESEKFQAAEEARVIVTKHHEYINSTLKDQLTEAITANTQYREEIDAIRFALSRREEVIRSLEEEITKLRSSKAVTPPTGSSYAPPAAAGGHGSPSPFSHEGSQGSRSSQDRLSNEGVDEDGHRASGLLGKVFGGGWFSGTKTKDNTSPGYNNSSGNGSARRGSGLYRQAW